LFLSGFGTLNFKEHGIPTLKEYVAQYCHKLGISGIDNFDFYLAFVCFRVAAILQGVYKRALKGNIPESWAFLFLGFAALTS
jgi:aminoglycoside phosphotransferase (APT) family kinase protein